MKFRVTLVMMLVLIFGSVLPSAARPAEAAGVVLKASYVAVAFWTWGVNPHFGAFFGGRNGRAQFYTGPNGPANYNTYNWWDDNLNVLLLEKRWYSFTSGAGNPLNHNATLDCPC